MQRSQLLLLTVIVTAIVIVEYHNLQIFELSDDEIVRASIEHGPLNRVITQALLLTIIVILLMREPQKVVITNGHDKKK